MAPSRAALLCLVLGACATPPPTPPPTASTVVLAPVPKQYSCAQSAKAAAEFMALPADSQLAVMISDFYLERRELRAVLGLPDPPPCPKPAS